MAMGKWEEVLKTAGISAVSTALVTGVFFLLISIFR
jgi:hypothetical protein